MTILKDKYGNEIDSKDFENKGYGEFGKHIRRTIDPDWGISFYSNTTDLEVQQIEEIGEEG